MAQRSKFASIPNVTTVVNLFEIRKGRNRIVFGDLDNLKNVFELSNSSASEHEQGGHFTDGNYSVSVLNYMEKKPVVVIHQENVDPCVMVKKTIQPSTATIARSTKGSVLYPFHWLLLRRAWSSGNGNQTRDQHLVWKSGEKVSADVDQMKEIDSTGLLYFVSDLPHAEVKIAYSSRALYKLTSNNTNIGFAVDLAAIFDANGFSCFLFEDPISGCFASVVRWSDKVGTLQNDNKENFKLSMSSCLYDSVYRSFYKNGIDNHIMVQMGNPISISLVFLIIFSSKYYFTYHWPNVSMPVVSASVGCQWPIQHWRWTRKFSTMNIRCIPT